MCRIAPPETADASVVAAGNRQVAQVTSAAVMFTKM